MATLKDEWVVSEALLMVGLKKMAIEISPDSPLASLPPQHEVLIARTPAWSKDQQRALSAVCQPAFTMGMLLSPPHGLDQNWLFDPGKSEAALVHYQLDANGDHNFREVEEKALLMAVRDCLHFDTLPETGDFKLLLTSVEYQALLGLADANRERSLSSLLDRVPSPRRSFTAAEVSMAFQACLRYTDRRWLTCVAQLLTPFDLTLSEADCVQGLDLLARRGLVEQNATEWRLTDTGRVFCAALASPMAYAALHGRWNRGNHSKRENIAAFRTLECLWLLNFQNLDSANPTIELRPVTGEEAELAFSERLFEWRRAARQSAQSRERPCGACGGAVAKDAKFCRHCGTPVVTPNAAPIQDAKRCPDPSCGRVIIPGKFCVACGTALDVSFGPQELETAPQAASKEQRCGNPSCREAIPSGKKFCPSCGTPVGGLTQSVGINAARAPSSRRCPTCGEEVAAGKKFCRNDGTRID